MTYQTAFYVNLWTKLVPQNSTNIELPKDSTADNLPQNQSGRFRILSNKEVNEIASETVKKITRKQTIGE